MILLGELFMDRRSDLLFRRVIDQVAAGLTDCGFRLLDRGWLGEYRWVEYTRLRWDQPERAREEHLVVYHLADHRHVGARLHTRNPIERSWPGDVAMNQWGYEPGAAMGTGADAALGAQVRGWVTSALARGN
jgi:hypothetical protein